MQLIKAQRGPLINIVRINYDQLHPLSWPCRPCIAVHSQLALVVLSPVVSIFVVCTTVTSVLFLIHSCFSTILVSAPKPLCSVRRSLSVRYHTVLKRCVFCGRMEWRACSRLLGFDPPSEMIGSSTSTASCMKPNTSRSSPRAILF